jgi:hypothetical protein
MYDEALETGLMLYNWFVAAGHCIAIPDITPGATGPMRFTVIDVDLAVLVPHEFVAVTFKVPLVAEELKLRLTELLLPIIVTPVPVYVQLKVTADIDGTV